MGSLLIKYSRGALLQAGPLIDRLLWLSLWPTALLQRQSEAITVCHVKRHCQGL